MLLPLPAHLTLILPSLMNQNPEALDHLCLGQQLAPIQFGTNFPEDFQRYSALGVKRLFSW